MYVLMFGEEIFGNEYFRYFTEKQNVYRSFFYDWFIINEL